MEAVDCGERCTGFTPPWLHREVCFRHDSAFPCWLACLDTGGRELICLKGMDYQCRTDTRSLPQLCSRAWRSSFASSLLWYLCHFLRRARNALLLNGGGMVGNWQCGQVLAHLGELPLQLPLRVLRQLALGLLHQLPPIRHHRQRQLRGSCWTLRHRPRLPRLPIHVFCQPILPQPTPRLAQAGTLARRRW